MKQLISLVLLPLTSFLAYFHSSAPTPTLSSQPKSSISITFAGDLMLDRTMRQIGDTKGYDYIFSKLTTLFHQSDIVVANVEGPVTNNASISVNSQIGSPQNYIFTFDPIVLPTLFNNNIRLVNVGNNHILNFGQLGLQTTRSLLDQAQIGYFGDTGDQINRYKILSIRDIRVAFVNYNQTIFQALGHTLADIETVRWQSDVVVVYCHWGNEYQTQFSTQQQHIAHQLIDAGADIIIGSHPHVVQPSEMYHNRPIYYSLGNFVFDQYFSAETQRGLLLTVSIDSNTQLYVTERPISIPPSGQINLWYANAK